MIVNLNEDSFERLRNGDEKVFEALFNGYFRPLFARVYQKIQRSEAAEDIVIETFYKLWHERAKMRDPWHVQNFLFVTANNAAVDILRDAKKAQIKNIDSVNGISNIGEMSDAGASLYDELDHSLVLQRIEEEINELPPRRRQVFRMYWMEGKNVDEIASMMDIRPSTVYNQLAAAYKQIRKGLENKWLVDE